MGACYTARMQIIPSLLQFDGLGVLVIAVLIAGIVRGFSGFGTALVFVPIAATVAPPIWVILMMMMFDIFGLLFLLPRAWRDGEPKDVAVLGVGALIALPLGVYLLTRLEPNLFRWLVSTLSFTMLVLLLSGWRYGRALNAAATMLIGMLSGFLAGVAALPGPPVILSYLSSPRAPQVIRANTMMYLFLVDLLTILVFAVKTLLVWLPLLIGLLLAAPYALGGYIGQRIFNPQQEAVYRRVAYAIIAVSALIGLPIWGTIWRAT